MKNYTGFILLCMIAMTIIGCGKAKGPMDDGTIVATIGDETITLAAFEERLDKLPDSIRSIAKANKAAYLENLVVEDLLYKEAVRKGLDKDEDIVMLFEEARKRILIARLAQDEIDNKINISERDIKAYYNENKSELESPQLYRASHILVDTMEEASQISDKLTAGALFEELAREYSKDVTSKRGGDIGYFSSGQMLPEFEDACIKLKIGETSGPVKTQFGYHIIKLTDKRGPEPLKYADVKDRIEKILMTQKRGRLLEALVNKLKTETKVTINTELLGSSGDEPQEELYSRSSGGPIGVEGIQEW
ncbi:MAG: peptidylprolyl isomerase [Candidatus Omnitrophota bacterium]